MRFIIACMLAVHAPTIIAQDEFQIEFKDGLVWLDADGADLHRLLRQFSIEIGFKLWMSAALEQQSVRLHSKGKTTEETLRKLLTTNSYALVHDDNGVISELYVLPPGKTQSTPLSLSSTNVEDKTQLLREALQSKLLPDDIKAAMLDQFGANKQALQQPVTFQRVQALQQVIENLQKFGSPSDATIQQLQLRLESELQNE